MNSSFEPRPRAFVRCIAAILIPLQVLAGNMVVYAEATSDLQNIALTAVQSVESAKATLAADMVVPNTSLPPSSKPDFSLHFSTHPKEQEIEGISMLPQGMVVIGNKTTSSENAALAAALITYSQQKTKERFQSLTAFLQEYPQSGWKPALLTNLGMIYRQHGYYTRALDAWTQAWKLSKNEDSLKGRAVADRAVAELARLLSSLGRTEQLHSLLGEIKKRKMYGAPATMVLNAKEGLAVMKLEPGMSYKCGPFALGNVQNALHPGQHLDHAILQSQSSSKGFSLGQLNQLAQQIKLNYQVAKRQSGASLIVPSVVHWKSNHYAAIVKAVDGGYLVKDPTFQGDVVLSKDAIEDEASGYFLIPSGPLPTGWTTVSDAEMKAVHGKGFPGPRTEDTTPNAKQVGGSAPHCGMATYSILSLLACLHVEDTPVGYTPPVGPDAHFTVGYNQFEASQPTSFFSSNFGNDWINGWNSYVQIAPTSGGSTVTLTLRGGGTETFDGGSNYAGTATQGNYGPQVQGQATLYVLPTTNPLRTSSPADPNQLRFERHLPDGSAEIYDSHSDAQGNIFLTEIIDPQGNALTLNYTTIAIGAQNVYQLASVTDAIGQVTTLSYGLSADLLKITQITDPFGRYASFTYTTASPYQLVKITDVIGLTSQFTYATGTDAITALTTPYGTTTFLATSSSTGESAADRTLLVTDPQGAQEQAFARFEPDADAYTKVEPLPSASFIDNDEGDGDNDLEEMNTYYWDKKAMLDAPNDLTKAHIDHWLANTMGGPGPVVYSEKNALESRVWYNYSRGVYDEPFYVGTSDKPTGSARILDDGTTQIYQYSYNSLGKLTQSIDPIGRSFSNSYYTNGIDLYQTTQTKGGANDLLATYTWNTQHLPLTYLDAAGQLTKYSWNGLGQITSVLNAKGETTSFTYYTANTTGKQRLDRLYQVIGALPNGANTVTLDYDAYGNVASVTGPDGYQLQFTYDALSRPVKVIYPDSTYTQTTYQYLDPYQQQDRLGRITKFVYNSVRLLTSVTDPANRTTYYNWCKCGHLNQIVDAIGRATTWQRDVEGRVTAKVYVDGSQLIYSYGPNSGRLITTTDETGQVKTNSYNPDDTLQGITYTNATSPTPNVSFTYDPNYLRLLTMTDGIGLTTYNYNPINAAIGAGQLASVVGPWANDTISYGYDQLGRVISRAINGVAESTTIDPAGRIMNITNPLGSFTYGYDGATSRLLSAANSGGVKSVFAYYSNQQDDRLQSITNYKADGVTPLSIFNYTSDDENRILTWKQQQDTNSTTATTSTFGYDNADQLTSDIVTQGTTTTSTSGWGYDLAGNRTDNTLNGTDITSSYNALNELKTNTGTLPGVTYQWDAEHRLVAINRGTASSQFSYDGLGRRVKIVELTSGVATSTTTYVWDGMEIREQRDATGAIVQQRYYDQGFQGVTGANIGIHLYTRDHLGSIREIVDTTGALQERISYDAWGNPSFSDTTPITSFAYTGFFLHQPSGLQLAQYRAYSAQQGRWTSRDPLGENGGLNMYAYCVDDPIEYFDPSGLESTPATRIVLGVTGAVGLALALRAPQSLEMTVGLISGEGLILGANASSSPKNDAIVSFLSNIPLSKRELLIMQVPIDVVKDALLIINETREVIDANRKLDRSLELLDILLKTYELHRSIQQKESGCPDSPAELYPDSGYSYANV